MRALQLAMRMLGREWKSGELGVLMLALTVAVAALTGVGFLVNRISQAVELQATEVLAADLRLQSPNPLPEDFAAAAQRQGLKVARATSVLSVVFRGDLSPVSYTHLVTTMCFTWVLAITSCSTCAKFSRITMTSAPESCSWCSSSRAV